MDEFNRCDFADELVSNEEDNIKIEEIDKRGLKIKRIKLLKDYNKFTKKGNYLSFEIDDLSEKILSKNKRKIIIDQLNILINDLNVVSKPHVLMVGLGNDEFSSDALGPETIKNINANSYLDIEESKVSCIIPGVMKMTGLESASIIKSLIDKFNFDLVIVFDSLATKNIDRLFKVIQITDTELIPGSGVDNIRKSLNSAYFGIPLIAVGVSMAIMYRTIIEEYIDNIFITKKMYSLSKKYINKQLNNNLVLTGKDSELKVKYISKNLALIFNELFS